MLTYDELSVKSTDKYEIKFRIKNVPLVDEYIDQAEGKLTLVEVSDNSCRLEGFFDLRISYPVVGYYVAQVIRNQVVKDLSAWPEWGVKFLNKRDGK